MRFLALVSAQTRRRMVDDPWLSQFDWTFGDARDQPAAFDLVVAEMPVLSAWPDIGTLASPCWCFGARHRSWDCPDAVDVFCATLDTDVLGDRLLAWLWLQGVLTPCCLSGLPLILCNGRLSFRTLEPSRYLLQMAVSPTSEVGGDVALYFESEQRSLVVLADAIGHGQAAALDAVQFVLGVVRHIVPAELTSIRLRQLCLMLAERMAHGRFVAAAFIELDRARGQIRLVNAGMPDILWLRKGELFASFSSTQPPLGLCDLPVSSIRQLVQEPCSQWVMYSDGVDGAGLLHSLALTPFDGRLPDAGSLAAASPLLKAMGAGDDASQVIIGIPGID